MCLPSCVLKKLISKSTQTEDILKSPVSRYIIYEDNKQDIPHYIYDGVEMVVLSPKNNYV